MIKNILEEKENTLASLHSRRYSLKQRQDAGSSFSPAIRFELADIDRKITFLEYDIFSIKYPRFARYVHFFTAAPIVIAWVILTVVILLVAIELNDNSSLVVKTVINLSCLIIATFALFSIIRQLREANDKYQTYMIHQTNLVYGSLLQAIEQEALASLTGSHNS